MTRRRSIAAAVVAIALPVCSLSACDPSSRDSAPHERPAVEASEPSAAAKARADGEAPPLDGSRSEAPDALAADAGAWLAARADAGPASDASAASPPAASGACPSDMVFVEGAYCPSPIHECLDHHPEYDREQKRIERLEALGEKVGRSNVSERCLRYKSPAVCFSKKRRPMRFCMDRYEWPNQKGELPRTLVSWHDAAAFCAGVGKRLCTADEFDFACEGEQMLPYPYGYVRDDQKCNIDRPYVRRTEKLLRWDDCMGVRECRAEFEKLDQRVPAGSMPECVSPFGVYDITGNVNEWVERPGEKTPYRSGLKGGWWGPVRNRCRPMTTFHKEHDWGYEQGFRCCRDAGIGGAPSPSQAR